MATNAPTLKSTWFQRYSYRNYRSYYSMRERYRRRITRTGTLVLCGLVMAMLLGVDTNLSMAYQAFTFLIGLVIASLVVSRVAVPNFSAERILPRHGSVGAPLPYRIVVKNLTKRGIRGVSLLDEMGDPRPTLDEFVSVPEPGEEKRNWIDRRYAYYRWLWLLARNERAKAHEYPVPSIAPLSAAEVTVELMPMRRGVLRFTGVMMACPDAFGLYRLTVHREAPQSVLILPKRYPVPRFTLPGAMKYQQGGVALAASIGESEEFVSLRDYRPGDPRKNIHWKSWAKMGKPIVKEFQDEFFVRHALILDTFDSLTYSDRFEEAVSVAASFAYSIQIQESLLDLMFVGPQAYCFTAGRGLAHTEQMLEILASVSVCRDKAFEMLSHAVIDHASKVSGCICIFINWDEQRHNLVKQLKLLGLPTVVFVVVDKGAKTDLHPGPMQSNSDDFHVIETGKAGEALARL